MKRQVRDREFRRIRDAERSEERLFDRLGLREIRDRLERDFEANCETEDGTDFEGCIRFQRDRRMMGAEIFFVPDHRYYARVLSRIPLGADVLDAGAGDLRFSLALSKRCSRVYAVEINPKVLGRALTTIGYDLPKNVIPVCADVFSWPVPEHVTHVVCIMIHRHHVFPADWLSRRIVYADFQRGVLTRLPDRKTRQI